MTCNFTLKGVARCDRPAEADGRCREHRGQDDDIERDAIVNEPRLYDDEGRKP